MMGFNLDDYEPVEARLERFWADHPSGRIETDIAHYDEKYVVIRASLFDSTDCEKPSATGIAEEVRGAGRVNSTSHVENCETSAIGRALANRGYATGKRQSREEMQKVSDAATDSVAEPVTVNTSKNRLIEMVGDAGKAKALWKEIEAKYGKDTATVVMMAASVDEIEANLGKKK